ncbi:nucleotide pyrophosphatase/phosphodiesterase family protein [Colwellia sp. E2M01]|uniref:alkaline phosphatase family protein n=1 Tax=Colwellia sp. E2M01 TaxID=2841561 RepID=UPI001C09BA5B|nr:nucleotide pyrophosphatase/phosphodiesterase family protein [Colwellia sp. E2M01]MBU2869432.1 alkaline phosphatase family protein [Colwellia sp. E2M01]
MSAPLVVLNVVGLSPYMLGEHTPNLNKLLDKGYQSQSLAVEFPAVTTTAQSAMVTGKQASEHGIVGNGWYFHELAEVGFWKQANQLVQSDKIWDVLKKKNPALKVSKLFWWYNMYANVDNSMTPRPHYLADGNKIFDLYSSPNGLHQNIESDIGKFPFFNFWGPKAGIGASQWIAKAAVKEFELNKPDLQLVYLPHLDYCLQKLGPEHTSIPAEILAIDKVVGEIIDAYQQYEAEFMIVSEYGITAVNKPIHINRILREQGYIEIRETQLSKKQTIENIDCAASEVFAVSDHQCAHVYIKNKHNSDKVKNLLLSIDGIDEVLDKEEQKKYGLAHQRSGDLVAISNADAWFTYYFWLDDNKAPEFARTVDIHRKIGYDPVEMFIDPDIQFPLLKVASKVLRKKLGFRYLMDVIPLDADLIKGSHGRITDDKNLGAILIASEKSLLKNKNYKQTDVFDLILAHFSNA